MSGTYIPQATTFKTNRCIGYEIKMNRIILCLSVYKTIEKLIINQLATINHQLFQNIFETFLT